ncbi:MAG: hypothetical protein MJ000_05300 [Bacteroidales bacterium]|nr:hypothetical protein [Bacteroidales bacterium]
MGNSESGKEVNYFLPLLPVWIKDNRSNIDGLIEKNNIKELDSSSALPSEINTMISFQGYKLLYRHLESGHSVISLRDIHPTSLTDSETNPFLFIIMSNSESDVQTMDKIADYFAHNINEVSRKICECLYYDSKECGLCFRNKEVNDWINSIVTISNGKFYSEDVCLLVLEVGSEDYTYAEQSQKFSLDQDSVCYGIDENWELHRILINKTEKKKKISVLTMAWGVLCLVLLLVGGVLLKNPKEKSINELPTLLQKDSTDFKNSSEDSTITICPKCGKECPWCGTLEIVRDSVKIRFDSVENESKQKWFVMN